MIDINELIPSIKTGWVVMDKNCRWWWFKFKPTLSETSGVWFSEYQYDGFLVRLSDYLNIKPVESWANSLIEVKND